MAEEYVLKVELDGVSYVLRGVGGEERLQETARLVEQKIASVRQLCPHYSTTRATMLAALQLADEMLALQDEYLEMLEAADIGAAANISKNKNAKGS